MRQDWLQRLNIFFTLSGTIFILAGACAIVLPLVFSVSETTLTRWILVAGGVVALLPFVKMFGVPTTSSFLLLAILHLGVGIWMFISSSSSNSFIIIMIGWFAVHGLIKILMACQLRDLKAWPAILVSGIVSIVLAGGHFALTSSLGLTFYSILFGADLALTGLSFCSISLMAYLETRANASKEPLLEEGGYRGDQSN